MGRLLAALKRIEAQRPAEVDRREDKPSGKSAPTMTEESLPTPFRSATMEEPSGPFAAPPSSDVSSQFSSPARIEALREPAGGDVETQCPREIPPPLETQTCSERSLEACIERLRRRSFPGRAPGYCEMAANILSQLPAGPSCVLLFMGLPDEPAPTPTLAPLAAVLGEALPQPILALDARSDRVELAECFGLACRWGLDDILAGQVGVYEALRKTSLGQLFILGGSPAGRFSWESLTEDTWTFLLQQLRKHYRLILIDGGSHPHPAEKCLLKECDGVYLVVYLGRTPKGTLRKAVEELEQSGGRVLGCIAATDGKGRRTR